MTIAGGILRDAGAERVRMVATSATRDATNREDFFGMVRATLGSEAEVISGDTRRGCRAELAGVIGARFRDLARHDPTQAHHAVTYIGRALEPRDPTRVRKLEDWGREAARYASVPAVRAARAGVAELVATT